MNDPYLLRLLEDLKAAESILRGAISCRNNPFRDNGDQELVDSQANVDRLHKLIQERLAKLEADPARKKRAVNAQVDYERQD